MNDIDRYSETIFEQIRHVGDNGEEFWYARELQKVLEYTEWRNFTKVIAHAIKAAEKSIGSSEDHFVEVNKMIELGKTARRVVEDYRLSRYACYLIAMNGDPSKEVIALAQTYFAVKTRQQELIEDLSLIHI